MVLVLGCMAAGMALGFWAVPEKYQKICGALQSVLVSVLIFCMGVGLGSDPALFEALGALGLESLLFAVIPVLCSVAAVLAVASRWFKGKNGKEKR